MGLLSNGNITLVDLTDNRSATLYLTTSLSKTQIETGNAKFEPDYSIAGGQVITPSLFFGSEAFNGEYNVFYNINGKSIVEYTEDYGFSQEGNVLYIRKNLIEASYFISAIIEKPIEDPITKIEYTNIQTQLELIKLHNAEENYLPLISYKRDIFTDKNSSDIVLTANLYKGGSKYEESDIQYEWTSLNDDFNTILGTDKKYTVTRESIVNVSNYVCKMTVNNNSYTAQVTIRDLTDPLFSEIISSHGLYTMDLKEEIILTCNVYLGADRYEDVEYQWYTQKENGAEFTPIEGATSKQYEFMPAQTGTYSYQCRAARTDKKGETIAQITIAASPEYKVEINPKEIFIACDKDGNIKLEESKTDFEGTINFKLIDHNGEEIVFDVGEGIDPDELKKNFEKLFTEGNVSIDPNSNPNRVIFSINPIAITQNYYSINIPYTYLGIELNEEFYLIKSIQGEMGEQGEQGEAAIYNHIRSNTSIITKKIVEKETVENSGEYKTIIQYSPKILTFNFWKTEGSNTTPQEIYWRYYIDNDTLIEDKLEDGSYISSSEFSLILGQGENEISPKSFIKVEAFIEDKDENGNNIITIIDSEQVEIISEEQQLIITASNDTITVPYSFDDENGWSGAIENASTTIKAYYGNTAVQGASFKIEPCIEGDELQYEGTRQDEDGSYFIKITNWGGSVEKEKRRRIITVTVTYGPYEIKKDIELIKVFNGQGVEGEEKFYALSNNGKTAPAENDVRWVDSVTEFPTDDLIYINYSFLWVKTILYFSDGTKTIGYSVFGWDGEKSFNISNVVEEYAFSNNYETDEETLIISYQKDFEWFSILEETIAEQTLLVRYNFDEINDKEKIPIYQAKDVKDLNLFLQYVDVLIRKYGIDLFASSVTKEGEGESNSNITYAETVMGIRAGEIKAVVEESIEGEEGTKKTTQSYLTFNTEGLTIGSENSDYYSQILNGTANENYLDAGFYIKYNNSQTEQKENVAILNTLGLRVKNINLNLKDSNFEQDLTITRTLTGGIAIGY